MYLSRIRLDTHKWDTMRALTSPNLFHGAIESAFPGERVRNLWRVDQLRGEWYLLLLSPQAPDLSHMVAQFGVEEDGPGWETKVYDSLLERIEVGTTWQFRLTANPTRSLKSKEHPQERGTVSAHTTPEHQTNWLLGRCAAHGFSVEESQVQVTGSEWRRFYKGAARRYPVSLLYVTFEGMLTVTDAEKFRETLQCGMGRGKAFGLGLMTVVQAHGR